MLAPPLVLELIDERAGDPGDFVFGGVLFLIVAVAFELAAWVPDRSAYRAGLTLAAVTALANIWINLAVGIIGSENNPANLVYGAVLAFGLLWASLVRFQPAGLAQAMTATAIAQAAIFIVVLIAGLGFTGPITVFFVGLWLTSAWLFRRAAQAALVPDR